MNDKTLNEIKVSLNIFGESSFNWHMFCVFDLELVTVVIHWLVGNCPSQVISFA